LHPVIEGKVRERLRLLRREGIVPSGKDPESILDLTLREKVKVDGQGEKELDPAFLVFLVTK